MHIQYTYYTYNTRSVLYIKITNLYFSYVTSVSTFKIFIYILQFARIVADGISADAQWLAKLVGWPPRPPEKLAQLVYLEECFDVFDLYLWLRYEQQIMIHASLIRP